VDEVKITLHDEGAAEVDPVGVDGFGIFPSLSTGETPCGSILKLFEVIGGVGWTTTDREIDSLAALAGFNGTSRQRRRTTSTARVAATTSNSAIRKRRLVALDMLCLPARSPAYEDAERMPRRICVNTKRLLRIL
jgi:hypothetical protein